MIRGILSRSVSTTDTNSVRSTANSLTQSQQRADASSSDGSGTETVSSTSKIKGLFGNGLEEVFIQLDEPHKVYGPGDTVRGSVVLTLSKATKTLYTALKFSGQVIIGDGKQRVRTSLFQEEVLLWTSKDHANTSGTTSDVQSQCTESSLDKKGNLKSGIMTAGRHVFAFEFNFPETDLPSSLDFGRGSIAYTLRCDHQKPKGLVNRGRTVCRKDLAFLENIDISAIPRPRIRHIDPDAKAKRREGGPKVQAFIELTKGACMKGDTLLLNVQVHHLKPIKSMKGIIATLYRLTRLDAHNLTPQSFRKDLSQTISPLLVDPQSLDFKLSTRLKVPADCFPTIKQAGPASFRYFVEVVIDLTGRTTVHQGKSASAVGSSNQFNIENGGTAMETDAIKREKGAYCAVFEVVVGTKASRNGTSSLDPRLLMPGARGSSYDSRTDGSHNTPHNFARSDSRVSDRDGHSQQSAQSISITPGLYDRYPLSKEEMAAREAALLPSAPPENMTHELQAPSAPYISTSPGEPAYELSPPINSQPSDSSTPKTMKEEEILRSMTSAPPEDPLLPPIQAPSAPSLEPETDLPSYQGRHE